jgi:hypothetical protein
MFINLYWPLRQVFQIHFYCSVVYIRWTLCAWYMIFTIVETVRISLNRYFPIGEAKPGDRVVELRSGS